MIFRYARHTEHIDKLKEFYTKILQLEIIEYFENHEGYDGIILGKKQAEWRLEFTSSEDVPLHSFDEDDALVFFPTTVSAYNGIMKNIQDNHLTIYQAKNPYWNSNGIVIQDPDGCYVVISAQKFNKKEKESI